MIKKKKSSSGSKKTTFDVTGWDDHAIETVAKTTKRKKLEVKALPEVHMSTDPVIEKPRSKSKKVAQFSLGEALFTEKQLSEAAPMVMSSTPAKKSKTKTSTLPKESSAKIPGYEQETLAAMSKARSEIVDMHQKDLENIYRELDNSYFLNIIAVILLIGSMALRFDWVIFTVVAFMIGSTVVLGLTAERIKKNKLFNR